MFIASLVFGAFLGLAILGLLVQIHRELAVIRKATSRNSREIRDNSLEIRDNSRDIQTSSDLVATHVGHELRTPLTTIMGTLATLQRGHERLAPAKRSEMIQAAIQQAQVLESLVAGMVSLEPSESKEATSTRTRARKLRRKRPPQRSSESIR